jgi:septation ring formation regulator EzrA
MAMFMFVSPDDWSKLSAQVTAITKAIPVIQANQAFMQAQLNALLKAEGLEAQAMADVQGAIDNLTTIVTNLETSVNTAVTVITQAMQGDPAAQQAVQDKIDALSARLTAAQEKLDSAVPHPEQQT